MTDSTAGTRPPTSMTVSADAAQVTLIFEPWADEHVLPPHATVKVVWDNHGRDPELEVVHHPDAIVFWSAVFPEVWTTDGQRITI